MTSDEIRDALGLCGCAQDVIERDLVAVLRSLNKPPGHAPYCSDLPVVGDYAYKELLLHWLDAKGLLEHGVSVRASWLSKEGRELAERLEES